MLSQMDGVASFELQQTSLFKGCNKEFCKQVERIAKTRLVNPGSVILKEGSEERVIRFLKCGSAIVDDGHERLKEFDIGGTLHGIKSHTLISKACEPTRITGGAVVNADVVLGTACSVKATVHAERLCAVGEIEGTAFLGILQRFPKEIMPLVAAASGPPWPTDADFVPVFKGVNPHFFNQLMSRSQWSMVLPDQCVVKQGGRGDLLFLLCYGAAFMEVDDIVIGIEYGRGDCIGKLNFLGLSSRYSATVRTRLVSHFRTMSGKVLTELLVDHVAEREHFKSLKRAAQNEAAEQEIFAKEQVSREKLRQREENAFRGHVSRERFFRGLSQAGSLSGLAPHNFADLPDDDLDPSFQEFIENAGDKDFQPKSALRGLSQKSVALLQGRRTRFGTNLVDKMRAFRKDMGQNSAYHHRSSMAFGKSLSLAAQPRRARRSAARATVFDALAAKRASKMMLATSESMPEVPDPYATGSRRGSKEKRRATASPVPNLVRRATGFAGGRVGLKQGQSDSETSSDSDEDKEDDDDSSGDDSKASLSSAERISTAICQHTDARKRAILKGRLLRWFHSGLVPEGKGGLSQKDLKELGIYLSKGSSRRSSKGSSRRASSSPMPANSTSTSAKQQESTSSLLSAGWPHMQEPSEEEHQALQRKYCQISSRGHQFGAVLPGTM